MRFSFPCAPNCGGRSPAGRERGWTWFRLSLGTIACSTGVSRLLALLEQTVEGGARIACIARNRRIRHMGAVSIRVSIAVRCRRMHSIARDGDARLEESALVRLIFHGNPNRHRLQTLEP